MSTVPITVRLHRGLAGYEVAGLPGGARPATHADPWRLPSRPATDDAWRSIAACRSMPIELFFPARGQVPFAAKAICSGCPVAEACLAAALAEEEGSAPTAGIRGGLSPRERARLRHDRRAGV